MYTYTYIHIDIYIYLRYWRLKLGFMPEGSRPQAIKVKGIGLWGFRVEGSVREV